MLLGFEVKFFWLFRFLVMLLLLKVSLLLFFSRCGNYLGMFVAVRVVVRFKAVLVGTNYVLYNLKIFEKHFSCG